jgi:tetratricopeptide (TPR) repeat protein
LENKYPLISPTYRYHAYLEILEGRYQEAIDVLEEGFFGLTPLEYFPEDNRHKWSMVYEIARFYELFAWSYEALGDSRMAASYYEKIISIDPHHLPVYDKLIGIFNELGAEEEALYYLNKKKEYE